MHQKRFVAGLYPNRVGKFKGMSSQCYWRGLLLWVVNSGVTSDEMIVLFSGKKICVSYVMQFLPISSNRRIKYRKSAMRCY